MATPIIDISNTTIANNFLQNQPNPNYTPKYISYLTANTVLNEPNLTVSDVMNQDNQNLVIQQNNMYLLGAMTAGTLLILGIMLGGGED